MAKHSGNTNTGTGSQSSTASAATEATAPKKTRKPRTGPSLNWSPERDLALVQTMAGGTRVTSAITAALTEHPAFAGDENLLSDTKVRVRINYLRDKQGVNLPKVGRARYQVDASALNALLAGSGSGAGAGGDDAGAAVQGSEVS